MTTTYLVPTVAAPVARPKARAGTSPVSAARYDAGPRSRGAVVIAAILSAAVHAALILGAGHARKKVVARPTEPFIAVSLTMPDLKELEEPEPASSDESAAPDLA